MFCTTVQVCLKKKFGKFLGKPRPLCFLTPWCVFQVVCLFSYAALKDEKLDVANSLI